MNSNMKIGWIVGTDWGDTQKYAKNYLAQLFIQENGNLIVRYKPGIEPDGSFNPRAYITEIIDKQDLIRWVVVPSDSPEQTLRGYNPVRALFSPAEEKRAANFYKELWHGFNVSKAKGQRDEQGKAVS